MTSEWLYPHGSDFHRSLRQARQAQKLHNELKYRKGCNQGQPWFNASGNASASSGHFLGRGKGGPWKAQGNMKPWKKGTPKHRQQAMPHHSLPLQSLLSRALRKIQTDRAEGIVVAPLWKNLMFWPMLVNMLTANPILLSHRDALLTRPDNKTPKHPLRKKMSLVVCRVSRKGWKQQDFLTTLPPSSWRPGT
ncbi:hypothetical protein ACOMHN_013819 [Nucella lapillus]